MSLVRSLLVLILSCYGVATALAAPASDAPVYPRLPVREVTVFKDGTAFVQQEGQLPVTAEGTAILDELPLPILGTFWPYAKQGVTLRAVTAARVMVDTTRDAATVRELLLANVGTSVRIRESGPGTPTYEAKVLAVRGDNLALLQTEEGVRLVNINGIAEVTLLAPKPILTRPEQEARARLTLTLGGAKAGSTATVGLMYLQPGLRWIPNYKVEIDGAGKARVAMQATLVNDLVDLDNVTLHLVIGVPTFDFKETTDPIALQDVLARVVSYNRDSKDFSNAIMTQSAKLWGAADANTPYLGTRQENAAPAPTVSGSESKEDLYVFTVKNVRLKRGERMVLPITTFTLTYCDVYKLELPPVPPRDWQTAYYNGNATQLSQEVANLLAASQVKHYLRLQNTSDYPLTTAPALLLSGERVLAQGTTSYTPQNGVLDLPLTRATNIKVERKDKEAGRTPNAANINGYQYTQVDLAGNITLTNYGTKPAEMEVNRYVLGTVVAANNSGVVETLDLFGGTDAIPAWWTAYNWPNDLGRVNGLGRATWKTTIAPGKSVDLTYTWRYLWR